MPDTFTGPNQRVARITPRMGVYQALQCFQKVFLNLNKRFPPAAGLSDPLVFGGRYCYCIPKIVIKFFYSYMNGGTGNAAYIRHFFDPTMTQRQRLNSQVLPPNPFIQLWQYKINFLL